MVFSESEFEANMLCIFGKKTYGHFTEIHVNVFFIMFFSVMTDAADYVDEPSIQLCHRISLVKVMFR